ncbi:MAG: DNA primase, partial [Dehalococcoidia bacterium]|nr:DNA primase [Dehalococcoidia bacterium]
MEPDDLSTPSIQLITKAVLEKIVDESELFHCNDSSYATVSVGDHTETWLLTSREFRTWVSHQCYSREKVPLDLRAFKNFMPTLEGMARHEGREHEVHTRLAEHNGSIFLDLANAEWQVVEITPTGWEVVSDCPVKFRRPKGMLALPTPERKGAIDELRPYVNVASEEDWVLVVAWLVAALRPTGPYPVLALYGEQGSAKSTTARVLRALVDPNRAPLRSEPPSPHELMISAMNSWVTAYDNLSSLSKSLSNGLCRLATGGGIAVRELYTDTDEVILDAQRPVLLTSIPQIVTRPDLLDRSLPTELPAIPEGM